MQLFVRPDGKAQCLYSEEINLASLGKLDIKRASHVEPESDNTWTVDLSPVGGPTFKGYRSRAEALAAEATWLNNEMAHTHVVASQNV